MINLINCNYNEKDVYQQKPILNKQNWNVKMAGSLKFSTATMEIFFFFFCNCVLNNRCVHWNK